MVEYWTDNDLARYINGSDGNKQVDPLAFQVNDTITVQCSGIGVQPPAVPMTLIAVDAQCIQCAYQDGEDGPVQVFLVPWGAVRFLSKTVE